MKNIIEELLIKELHKRFAASAVIESLEDKVQRIAELLIKDKYSDTPLFNDGLEYKFEGVNVRFSNWDTGSLNIQDAEVSIAYFCVSKLTKAKRERIEKVKSKYKKRKHLEWSNYKIPIWKELNYTIRLENILSNNINLRIE